MKPLVLDFVPDRAPRRIWTVAILLMLCLTGYTAVQWRRVHAHRLEVQRQLDDTQRQIAELSRRAQPAPDPRAGHTAAMQRGLQTDLNGVFSTVERVKVPGTRLTSLAIDVPGDAATIEYRIDSMGLVPGLNEALNAGFDTPRWSLETASIEGTAVSSFPAGIGMAVKARWTAKIGKLK